jgi:mRNA-degrading endonuclease RelE of RelBE toxin-antitoxin system
VSAEIVFQPAAKRSLTRLRKDDPAGVDQVLDSINLLTRNPRPAGARSYGSDTFRLHVGAYRVLYVIKDGSPVVISIELVGRIP